MNQTPRNIADAVQDQTNVGAAAPVLRLGRTAYGIADDAEAAGALTARQNDQYGRSVGIINRAAKNRDYDSTIQEIDDLLGAKSKQAYGLAHANSQEFDLQPTIQALRKNAFESAGPLREKMESAIDLFFEPTTGAKPMSEAAKLRIVEQEERVADLIGKGASEEAVFKAQRRLEAMQADADAETIRKLGQPISDVKRYQAARQALDQMIETSYHDNKATTLTRKLTEIRKAVNQTVRQANPLLAAADDQFSGAKTTQALLKRGEELNTRLGHKSDEFFKDYKSLNGEQREVIRLGFLRSLANKAANPRDGAAVAGQFQSPAVRETIRRLFTPDPVPKNITPTQKKALDKRNREIIGLGKQLIQGMKQEATTTTTLNAVTNRGNTQTAPWARDMEMAQQGAEIVGDAMTLNWRGVLAKTGRKLATQIGERQAKAILANLTDTDPASVLATLRRLADQAKSSGERKAYVLALKEFAKVGRMPGAEAGTLVTATGEER
jgi:hypothetical protein